MKNILPCVICGCDDVEIYTIDATKPDEVLYICREHRMKCNNDALEYTERILLKEFIEANFGEIV